MTPHLAASPPAYVPRDPSTTVLYHVVADHLETFLASLDADIDAKGLPAYVQRELYDYLQCGILAHGFFRLGCDACHKELLLPFSCKRRGFCPSCAGRRMAQTAAHLVERVIPWVPTRRSGAGGCRECAQGNQETAHAHRFGASGAPVCSYSPKGACHLCAPRCHRAPKRSPPASCGYALDLTRSVLLAAPQRDHRWPHRPLAASGASDYRARREESRQRIPLSVF